VTAYNDAEQTISETRFPFRWGSLTPAALDKLKFVFGDWFADQRLPEMPFALLLDSRGDVVSYYPSETIVVETILADVQLADQNQQIYRDVSSPVGGRWLNSERHQDRSRLISRLEEVGYPATDTQEIRTSSRPRLAYELCQMGVELQARNDMNAAKAVIDKAISVDGRSALAFVASGNLQRRVALSIPEEDDNARLTLQKQAAEDFEEALELDPLNKDAIIGKANVFIDQGRTDEALRDLLNYVKVVPDRYDVKAIIGRLYYRKQQPLKAAEFLVPAFENRPSLPFVAGDLGVVYLRSGEYKQALKFLLLANRLQPSNNDIFRALAEAEFVNGNFEKAVNLFEQVVEQNPAHMRSRQILAWLLATCPYESKRDGQRCLDIIKPFAEVQKDSPVVLEIYAAGFAEIADFENALKYQEEAIKLIEDGRGTSTYTDTQKIGMRDRGELYKRKSPYRSSEPDRNPILPAGG
jgi:tetratricopeptide (TPR) repeat protein